MDFLEDGGQNMDSADEDQIIERSRVSDNNPHLAYKAQSAARPRVHARDLPWCNSARLHGPSETRRVRRESAGQAAAATAPPSAGQPCTPPEKKLPGRGGRGHSRKRRDAPRQRPGWGGGLP